MAVSAFHVTVCSPLIEGYNLTVDHGVIRKLGEGLDDGWMSHVEVVVVPRAQMDLVIPLERNGPITVQLQLIEPLLPRRKRISA